MRFHRAGFDAEAERAAAFELELAVDARLLDVGVLLLVRDAQDLRTEAVRIERVVRVAARAREAAELVREQRAAGDRQAVVELELLRPEVRCNGGAARPPSDWHRRTRCDRWAPCRRG